MKFYLSLLAFVFLGFSSSFGQQIHKNKLAVKKHASLTPKNIVVNNTATAHAITVSGKKDKCGFAQMMTRAAAKGYDENAYEVALQKLIKNKIKNGRVDFAGPVTVPIIFHCIYRTGQAQSTTKPTPNLVAAAYQAQVDQLNKDYANRSLSTYGVAADVKIQFCMAVVDTTGKLLLEPGIDRINASTRGWKDTKTIANNAETYIDTTIKPATIWDPYGYFNVWTVAMDSSGLLGYATFPSSSTLNGISAADATETDKTAGVVMAWQAVGSVNRPGVDASYGYGRTLTHESGHFFGLRHIWGDATCGDDYCADTPPQDAETYGCPTTAADKKNNCIPAGPKMYQNYMDYSDDACLNTFTANQALRCQTTMDNSPRRMGLLKSKACVTRAVNSIQFGAASQLDVVETGKLGTCPSVQTYTFNIYISDKATGTATVTFSNVGGTALQNKDYTISPASITYAANDNGIKTVTVTVIDDQIVEPTETIQIGYTISGTGVVAGPEKQVISLNIIDDDIEVGINNLTPTKTIFSENFNASTALPLGWTTDVLDDGSGSYVPNQWVISPNEGTGTTGNAAHISGYPTTTKPNTYNNTRISDAYLFSPLIDATGVKDANLNFLWRCLGEVSYDEGYIGYIPNGQTVNAANIV